MEVSLVFFSAHRELTSFSMFLTYCYALKLIFAIWALKCAKMHSWGVFLWGGQLWVTCHVIPPPWGDEQRGHGILLKVVSPIFFMEFSDFDGIVCTIWRVLCFRGTIICPWITQKAWFTMANLPIGQHRPNATPCFSFFLMQIVEFRMYAFDIFIKIFNKH